MKKILLSLIIGGLFVNPVSAQTNTPQTLGIEPAYQEILISKEQPVATNNIKLKNTTQEPQEIELFINEFTQTGHFGMISFLSDFKQNYPKNTASFISLSQDRIVVEPNSNQEIEVRVEDRPSLEPGGHYLAVIARVVGDNQNPTQQKVLPALSSLLLIRKQGGEVINLSLKNIEWKPGIINLKLPEEIELVFNNDGNVHLIPRGSVQIKNQSGQVVAQGIVNHESFYVLPGTQRRIPVEIKPSDLFFPIAFLTLEVKGYSNTGEAKFFYETSFFHINYLIVVGLALIPIVTLAILRYRQHKRKSEDK